MRNRAKLTETLVAASAIPTAGARAPGSVSYLLGDDPRSWQSDLPTYEEVSLGEAWPGVSVVLRAHARNVEKIFTIRPGARVGRIRLRVDGVGPLAIDRDGALVTLRAAERVRFTAPSAYQERDGMRRPVAVAYVLHGSTYGFRVGAYDHAAPLVIDPVLQSTYIGGADPDSVNAIAIDPSSGEVLVAGHSYSTGGRGVDGFVGPIRPDTHDAAPLHLHRRQRRRRDLRHRRQSRDRRGLCRRLHVLDRLSGHAPRRAARQRGERRRLRSAARLRL